MNPTPTGGRSGDRLSLGSAAPVHVSLHTSLASITGTVLDLSLDGARIALDEAPERLRAEERATLRLGAMAVQVSIRHVDTARLWEPSCGVQFEDHPATVAEFIAAVSRASHA